MPPHKAAGLGGLGAALLTGWAVGIALLALYANHTGSGGTDLALALGAMAAGLLWPRIAAAPSLPLQLIFVTLLILPFLIIALLLTLFIAMVIRDIMGLVLEDFGLSPDAGSHRLGVDPGGMVLSFLLCWLALRAGMGLSLWGRDRLTLR